MIVAWAGELPQRGPRSALLVAILAVLAVVACTSPPRDLDMMVWSRTNWEPRQEQRDYAECFEHSRKAAYRKFHWRRVAVSREADNPTGTGTMSPSSILVRLQGIALDEKAATVEIAEACMQGRGYRMVPINEAGR